MMKFILLLMLLVPSAFVFAQKQPPEYNKVEVFAGYSNAAPILEVGDELDPVEHGFNAAVVYNFHRYFGVKVDVSGTYRNIADNPSYRINHSLFNVTAGIQVKNNKLTGRFKPFAHALAGFGKHSDKTSGFCPVGSFCPPTNFDRNGFSLIFGGGLDIKVNRRIDIRAVQFDVNPITFEESVYLNTRFSTGIVFKF